MNRNRLKMKRNAWKCREKRARKRKSYKQKKGFEENRRRSRRE